MLAHPGRIGVIKAITDLQGLFNHPYWQFYQETRIAQRLVQASLRAETEARWSRNRYPDFVALRTLFQGRRLAGVCLVVDGLLFRAQAGHVVAKILDRRRLHHLIGLAATGILICGGTFGPR